MFATRPSHEGDYNFLYDLKKAAEYEPIKAIFGWDEYTQQQIHQQEWQAAQPTIIEFNSKPIGSFLLQQAEDHLYFGRFFILPEFQGRGLGSKVLSSVIETSNTTALPIKLCYLQGNRVGKLYENFGFQLTHEDKQFVHMARLVI